ncbi:hypothetical protein HPB49_010529 [Dermacentor silvarum]|uniref:Uncharacterized protein n=1 Tax=Dermacentor silvarum TaxID=543639 RepID=A0ACB8D4R7_DERSI|nr:uncharacterized protein LOC119445223 [Dermacentor silvarum]KAH7959356.1 hypothetical protein HPB49_010529 [Dermacentor silvarum]
MDARTGKSLRLRLQDSRRSWFTLAMCTVMLHTATLGNRSQGALYVGMREHFGASHSDASFPPSLQSSLCLVGGIFTSLLCEVVSLRHMALGCSLISSLALIVCYFGVTVSFISFFFGAVQGLAASGMFVVTSVVVGEYFVRWRATAYAISSAAKSSHFLTPFAANHIRVHYGTPEIFLLLGALSLNGFVAALLVRTPPWRLKRKGAVPTCSIPGATNEQSLKSVQDKRADVTPAGIDISVTSDVAGATESLLRDIPEGQQASGACRTLDDIETSLPGQSLLVAYPCKVSITCIKVQHIDDGCPAISISRSATPWCKIMAFLRNFVSSFVKKNWKVIATPLYLFDTLSFSVQNYSLSNFVLFYLDVTIDCGIDASFAGYLLLAFNVSVVLGGLVIGVVVDRRLLSLNAAVMLGLCGNAAACEGLVWSLSGGQLLACAVVQGLSCGVMAPMACPALIRDFGCENLSLAIGGCYTVMGVVLLGRPPLVGYFKDTLGSYDGIQHIFASLNAFLAIMWMIRLLRSKRTNCT